MKGVESLRVTLYWDGGRPARYERKARKGGLRRKNIRTFGALRADARSPSNALT